MATGNSKNSYLADQGRGLFAERAARVLPLIAKSVHEQLSTLANRLSGPREAQAHRDALLVFQKSGGLWVNATARAWKAAQSRTAPFENSRFTESRKLELMGDDVVEDKILASRLALRILDFVSWELNDLRLRIQNLEGVTELPVCDILRPEILAHHMVLQWSAVALSRDMWLMVQDTLHRVAGEHFLEVYHGTNEFLVQQGVMVEIDLRPLVRRTPGGTLIKSAPVNGAGGEGEGGGNNGSGSSSVLGTGLGSIKGSVGRHTSVNDETRMQTATNPLARVRMRAQGVMGHLRRLLSDRVSD